MTQLDTHAEHIASIDDTVRHITWQSHKQLLQTLGRPDIALTMPQMVTLFAIRDSGTCRMSDLADITQQSAGTLTGIVDRLIKDGLVGRVRDLDDRRVVQVMLTPAGSQRLTMVEHVRREDMERMLHNFDETQIAQLELLLKLLLSGIQDILLDDERDHDGSEHGLLGNHLAVGSHRS